MIDLEIQLVQRCLAGDREAQREFIETFQSLVFALCYRMLGHREDAEDVTQEVFARSFRSLAGWDAERPLKPWICMIAANCCRTALSKRAKLPLGTDLIQDYADPVEATTTSDLAEAVQKVLQTVREEYRTCFILFYEQELSVTEVAQCLNCPEGTVKTWLYRVRREVANFLRQNGFEYGSGEGNDGL